MQLSEGILENNWQYFGLTGRSWLRIRAIRQHYPRSLVIIVLFGWSAHNKKTIKIDRPRLKDIATNIRHVRLSIRKWMSEQPYLIIVLSQ